MRQRYNATLAHLLAEEALAGQHDAFVANFSYDRFWQIAHQEASMPDSFVRLTIDALRLRFAHDGSVQMTYKEVGQRLRVTAARARTLVQYAISHLGHPRFYPHYSDGAQARFRVSVWIRLDEVYATTPLEAAHRVLGDPDVLARARVEVWYPNNTDYARGDNHRFSGAEVMRDMQETKDE